MPRVRLSILEPEHQALQPSSDPKGGTWCLLFSRLDTCVCVCVSFFEATLFGVLSASAKRATIRGGPLRKGRTHSVLLLRFCQDQSHPSGRLRAQQLSEKHQPWRQSRLRTPAGPSPLRSAKRPTRHPRLRCSRAPCLGQLDQGHLLLK